MTQPPLAAGQQVGRWAILGHGKARDHWLVRWVCGHEQGAPKDRLRGRVTLRCSGCGGRGLTDVVAPSPDGPLMSPADDALEAATDWTMEALIAAPSWFPPWAAYKARGYRAKQGQLGWVSGPTAYVFPVSLRRVGLDTTLLKRKVITIGKRGSRTINLAVRPVPITLTHDAATAWRAHWPNADDESKPGPKPGTKSWNSGKRRRNPFYEQLVGPLTALLEREG